MPRPDTKTTVLFARNALLAEGWASDVRMEWGPDGKISSLLVGQETPSSANGSVMVRDLVLPAPANLHSHTFQRAMAGMAETPGKDKTDTFWTWRSMMYRFVDLLTPDDIQAIAALAFMEMLEAGFAAVAEFHYLHHNPDGTPYAAIAETASRIAAAARQTGIGLTLLPVLYQYAGCDRQPLAEGQLRFGNSLADFEKLHAESAAIVAGTLPVDCATGVAPHSLRAVDRKGIELATRLAGRSPVHMHIAEQQDEVRDVRARYGQTPVRWLLDHFDVNRQWCLIHCTHMSQEETRRLAARGATAGLCPRTEANLGDGTFPAQPFVQHRGNWGIGTDSNISISLFGELEMLEYSQRLHREQRTVIARFPRSNGATLFAAACKGGSRATGRGTGHIKTGAPADLMALGTDSYQLENVRGDQVLDRLIFAGPEHNPISDVWSAGRHMVREGRHIRHAEIVRAYRKTLQRIMQQL